jgi:phage I-like protein
MSLIFAENAKKIKNNVSKNVESKEVAKLKDEIAVLRKQLTTTSGGQTHNSSSGNALATSFTSSS